MDYLIFVHICLSNNISRLGNKVAQWIAQCNAHREKMHRAIRGVRGWSSSEEIQPEIISEKLPQFDLPTPRPLNGILYATT